MNPYPGLRPFSPADAPYFYGRDNEIEELLRLLASKRFVGVTGVSGSGKSSLIRAGVIPVLRSGFTEALRAEWEILDFRPGGGPLAELARSLGVSATFTASADLKSYAVEKLVSSRRLLVFVDQFEEIFDYRRNRYSVDGGNESALFVNLLLAAADQREAPIHVVLTMRSDFVGECAQFMGLPEALNRGHYLVPRLTRLQQEQVITGPATALGVEFEPSLVQQLLNDSEDNPDQLPVLQHILKRLWEERSERSSITPEEYKLIGGWKDALARDGDGILRAFSPTEQNGGIARLFQWITGVGAAGQPVRRARSFNELPEVTGLTSDRLKEVIAAFIRRDFLQSSTEKINDAKRIDLMHESVIWNWPWLRQLVADEAAEAGRLNFLRESARNRQWLTGLSLKQGQQLQQRAERSPGWAERYLSRRERDEVSSWVRKSRWRQRLSLGGVVLAALMVAAGFWWVRMAREADRLHRQQAEQESAVAQARAVDARKAQLEADLHRKQTEKLNADLRESNTQLEATQGQLKVALGRSSVAEAVILLGIKNRQAMARLAHALHQDPDSAEARSWISSLLLHETWWFPAAGLDQRFPVTSAAFSPNGRLVVTGSTDCTARVWEAETGKPIGRPLQHSNWIQSAVFSPDGRRVVTASLDDTARVWETETGNPVGVPMKAGGSVYSARFSPDGQRVVTASQDGAAQVWDAETGKPVGPALQHKGVVSSAAFSPDGRRIVTATSDGTAWIWDTETRKPVGLPLQHQKAVNSAEFSPDGRRVVTASEDHTARVWDAETSQPIGLPLQHLDLVKSALFSPDGRRVITASFDRTAQVWDAETGDPIGLPLQHQGAVFSAVFSRDGWLVTASGDGTARVWESETGKPVRRLPLEHKSLVYSARFSLDGRRVVTGSADGTARVWEADTGKPIGRPVQHDNYVYSAVFSPDGRRIVTASKDGTARVWDANTGEPVGNPLQHRTEVRSAEFSPDGRRVVTASEDHTARIWNAETGEPIGLPLQHLDVVESALFSPDGRRVVTASRDYTAQVWDAETHKPVGHPLRHRGPVWSATFSPDGRRVVTASSDATAQVWDTETGKAVGRPLQHQGGVLGAAFSPDSRLVVTASEDHTARVWEAETGKAVGRPLQHGNIVRSALFSPDGRRVVTASEDRTARVWETETGNPVAVPLRHGGPVWSAVFSPDGQHVVTASYGDSARLWDLLIGSTSGDNAGLLAETAELAGGYRVNEFGSIVPVEDSAQHLAGLRRRIADLPDRPGTVAWFLRGFLPNPQPSH